LPQERCFAVLQDVDQRLPFPLLGRTFLGLNAVESRRTIGVGQQCGSGFSARAWNWKSVRQEPVQSCSGGFSGNRFTFTF